MSDGFGFWSVTTLEDADEDIAGYSGGSIILCTDSYTIYDGVEEEEGVDGYRSG